MTLRRNQFFRVPSDLDLLFCILKAKVNEMATALKNGMDVIVHGILFAAVCAFLGSVTTFEIIAQSRTETQALYETAVSNANDIIHLKEKIEDLKDEARNNETRIRALENETATMRGGGMAIGGLLALIQLLGFVFKTQSHGK